MSRNGEFHVKTTHTTSAEEKHMVYTHAVAPSRHMIVALYFVGGGCQSKPEPTKYFRVPFRTRRDVVFTRHHANWFLAVGFLATASLLSFTNLGVSFAQVIVPSRNIPEVYEVDIKHIFGVSTAVFFRVRP